MHPSEGESTARRYIRQGGKIFVSVVLLAVLLRRVDWRLILDELRQAQLSWVALAVGLFVLGVAVRAWRWRTLLTADGIHVPLSVLMRWYFIGGFFNTVLPTGFGGDVVKTYVIARYSARPGAAAGSVLIDRFSGIFMLLLMGALALIGSHGLASPTTAWLIWGLFAGATVVLAVMVQRGARPWIERRLPWLARLRLGRMALDAIPTYGVQPILRALGISLVFNLLLIGVNICLARALALSVPWLSFFIFVPLISVSLLLPSIGGLGVRELSYVALFAQAGVPAVSATALSLLYYMVTVLVGLLGGLMYLLPGAAAPSQAEIAAARRR